MCDNEIRCTTDVLLFLNEKLKVVLMKYARNIYGFKINV